MVSAVTWSEISSSPLCQLGISKTRADLIEQEFAKDLD